MKRKLIFTHEGWLLFCPIWANDIDNLLNGPIIMPKYRLELLFTICLWIQDRFNDIISFVNPDAQIGWLIYIKELDRNKVIKV